MRFNTLTPAYNTRRTVTSFLWWPVEIAVHYENGSSTCGKRWLESATWEEKWTKGRIGDFWKKMRWIN